MIKAALFDMDGLMVNTEPLQSQAYEAVLVSHGKQPQLNAEGVVQAVGVREKDNWELIKKSHDLNQDTSALIEQRAGLYMNILKQNLVPQPGLIDLLKLLKQHHIKMAVASSSTPEHIKILLEGLQVADFFDAVVSAHTITHGKPAPDIFLLAAAQLGVDPKDCVVLEDAQSGVEAGRAAEAKVIAVPNDFTKSHDHSKADIVVRSLEEIDWKLLSSL
jgi:HAD superfamily hydrolase (TIGR01509 family)